jgi:hypothetical protein
MEETRRRGLLIGKGGLRGNVLRLAPPLTLSGPEADEGLAIIEAALAAAERTVFPDAVSPATAPPGDAASSDAVVLTGAAER